MPKKKRIQWKIAKLAKQPKNNIKNAHELHLLAGVSYSTVRRLWLNEELMPSIGTLQPIATALKCKIEDLYE